jgi:ribosomal protein S18 acetylase RimI-like enzyme
LCGAAPLPTAFIFICFAMRFSWVIRIPSLSPCRKRAGMPVGYTTFIMEVAIGPADVSEAEQILKLRYLCYQSEATIYDGWSIPPLTQTLREVLREYDDHELLVARLGSEVVGSVRGRLEGDTCHIGRLVVHPRLQRRGIGARLMREIEGRFPKARRYELFTGHLSEGNLRLYRRLGYEEVREEEVSPRLRLVYLEKSCG